MHVCYLTEQYMLEQQAADSVKLPSLDQYLSVRYTPVAIGCKLI